MAQQIFKKILANGLTILACPQHDVPKVSTQLWYQTGSKHEKSGEKGLAHLIEHMIFKGTKILSESDINLITHKASGYCNAFTSYDYTGYLFDFPTNNWEIALAIMADCMRNCTFKQDHLNSEMKAVIQELKMYLDDYQRILAETMISIIFGDHPYHYPIVGFKQDLWNAKRENLLNFYLKHYVPNNATLVVVGDVDPEQVFALAEKYFGPIPADPTYQRETFYHSPQLQATSVMLHRDITQPVLLFSFVMPPSSLKTDFLCTILEWVLASGKSSRLYKRLVDELQLATDLDAFYYDLFDNSVFFIAVEPRTDKPIQETTEQIVHWIIKECEDIAQHGLKPEELERAHKQSLAKLLSSLESTQHQASLIGESFLKTGNENYIRDFINYPMDSVNRDLKELVDRYCRKNIMHNGAVLPLESEDRDLWRQVQEISDLEDARILAQATRPSEVEEGSHVHNIKLNPAKKFRFPKPECLELTNGLTVLFADKDTLPKIDLVVQLKADAHYDPEELQGLYTFMCTMMLEGTKNYTGQQLADEFERLGISLRIAPGSITMNLLKEDLPRALELLTELLTNATFPQEALEKIRYRMIAQLQSFWDNPQLFISQLARQAVYGEHPYHKNILGTLESLKKISRDDLVRAYQQWITPDQAMIAIVGDLDSYNVQHLLNKTLETWTGAPAESLEFPPVQSSTTNTITHLINRDQITLCFAAPSISRLDQNYDAILLCDQILTGGLLRSMSSRLFDLREQSGLFYTIGGSLLSNSDEQPGMVYIKTIVSPDRLQEAKEKIMEVICDAGTISDQELEEARNALASALINQFETNLGIARSFLFVEKYNLPTNYFDARAEKLAKITKEDISKAVGKLLSKSSLITICAGRL
jgi:zinc protease